MFKRRWQVVAIGGGGYYNIIKKYWFKFSADSRASRGNQFFREMGWDKGPIEITYTVERIDEASNSNQPSD